MALLIGRDITGRGKVIADGDFQLMRRFNSDDERQVLYHSATDGWWSYCRS